MIRKSDLTLLIFIYLAAVFFAFAIAKYFYIFLWNVNPKAKDELVGVRVFLSAPMLIIFGILLLVKFKNGVIHRIFGLLFLLCGVAWAAEIIRTILEEGA